MLSGQTLPRFLARTLREAMRYSPAVAFTGARTAGKSTLARLVVTESGGTFVDLDDPAVRRLAVADPGAFVQGVPEPVVIDEFQRAPDLLSAIKAELNRDRRPGRFVLTGSAHHEAVPELADYLTGRIELLTLWPFAEAELRGRPASFVDRLFSGQVAPRRTTAATRKELVELVLRGGYPIATTLPEEARSRWFDSLAELIVARTGDDVGPLRRPDVLARFLRLAAMSTAQVRNAAELGREIGLGRDQAMSYLRLLEAVHLVIELPAWSGNPTARVTKRPKIHLVDSGLAAHLMAVTPQRVSATDPAGATRFGALLETFVVTEVVKQLGWSTIRARPYHYRTSDGTEVDLVLEAADGRLAALEVKAGTQVATRGLAQLRDRVGDRFVTGVVVNTGQQAQTLGDRLAVVPVDELWGR